VGSPVGIAGLFIFWTYKSYQHMQKKLDEVQNGQRTKLEEISESSIKAVTENSSALQNNAKALERMSDALNGLECVRNERRQGEQA
jgi:hypothetical protein